MVTIGGWRVNAAAHEINRDGITRKLEPRVMDVLLLLAERAGSVVTRTELMTQVWGDTFITDDAVSAAIIKLRKAFGDDARRPRVIETVPKSGYRLVAEVTDGTPEAGTASPARRGLRSATVLRCELEVQGAEHLGDAEAWEQATADHRAQLHRMLAGHERSVTVMVEPTALVAVFGAPNATEHHALLAVNTAIELMSADVTGDPPYGVRRIGIASGEVLTSASSTDAATVFGAPTAHAASLAASAVPGEILIGTSTADLLADDVEVEPVVGTDGATEPIAFRVLGRRRPVTTWPDQLGATPMVGRAAERAALIAALEAVAHGRGDSFLVSAPAGVGKTRLVADLVESAREASMRVWAGFASPLDRHTPYMPLRALFTAAFSEALPIPDHAAVTALLRPDASEDAWSMTDPVERTARVAAVAEQLLLPDDQPTLIVIEDVHWADEATHALLAALASRARRHRCLLVVTTRVDASGASITALARFATVLPLRPLLPPDASSLLTALAGNDQSLDSWRTAILDRTAGTPLFLRECVAAAVTAGALIGASGAYVLDPGVALPPVPASLRGLLSERIDRLSPRARSVAEAAALIGHETDPDLLAEVIDCPDAERNAALTELDAAGIVEPSGTRTSPTYAFTHALLQEAAALGLPSDQRRVIHRRIATALERRPAGQETGPETLAHHWTEAGDAERAIPCWLAAASTAARTGAHDDALTDLERAQSLLTQLDDDDLRRRHALTIALASGSSLVQTVGPTDDAVLQAYQRAAELTDRRSASPEKFQAVWGRWLVHMMRGNVNELPPLADEVFALAGDLGDDALLLEAHHVQWSGLILAGHHEEARRHTEFVIQRYDPQQHHWLTYSYGGHDPGVCALNLNAMTAWLAGDRDAARRNSRRARDLADQLDHGYTLLESMQTALTVALVERQPDELDALTVRLDELVHDGRLPPLTSGFADGFRGAALAFRGDPGSAAALMQASCPVWQEFWGAWCHPIDVAYAEVLAQTGDVAGARAHVTQVLTDARATGAIWWEDRLVATLDALA